MIINNTNVRGIWSYSANLVFEKGDFVVDGDQIYICKASGVMGKRPYGNRDYFTEYPGNMVKSLDEYYKIVNNSAASDDLYISSRVLNEILQDSYFGLGDGGIIESVIESDGKLRGQISKIGNSEHVLDDLLTSRDFNNGVVLVSRKFADVKNLVGLVSFGSDENAIKRVVKIDPLKCIGCGECASICPSNAIELVGSETIMICSLCKHVYTQEDKEKYAEWSSIPYYHGHWTCPNCNAPVPVDTKIINNYKINTAVCNPDSCGVCFDSCPTGAIYTIQEDSTESGNAANGDEGGNQNQNFSTIISRYQVYDLEYVFVRQYSYKSGATGLLHRVQELVDPDQGLIFFRHAKQGKEGLTMDSTDWKSCLSRDAILIGKELNRIRKKMSEETNSTSGTSGFKYRSISVADRNNGAYFISNELLPERTDGVKRIVTFVVELQGKTISSYNSSVDLSVPSDFAGVGKTYYVNDEISFVIRSTTGGFDLEFVVDSDETLILKDVYCRESC